MEYDQKSVEVCFTPASFDCFRNPKAVVVVVDVLRATSAICTAFMNGVNKIIPVGTVEEAHAYKQKGYLVAAERDGIVLDFADFGNSPYNFTPERVKGKTIVYSTTNGTHAIQLASSCYKAVVGSFTNISAVSNWLVRQNLDVIVLCAGWKNRFSLEDTILAGAIVKKVLAHDGFITKCDSALAAMDLWSVAEPDLHTYIDKAAQRSRLRKNGLDDVIEYCHTPDLTDIVPIFSDGALVPTSASVPVC